MKENKCCVLVVQAAFECPPLPVFNLWHLAPPPSLISLFGGHSMNNEQAG